MNSLKLVSDNSITYSHQETVATPRIKSHLDIAVENGFLQDILNILISPESEAYHLSLKAEIDADMDSLWLNEFGDKEHVSKKAIEAISAVLEHGYPRDPQLLSSWRDAIDNYRFSPRRLIMLPD
jgi:hypothetical protein